jgi:hypothetical protein
MANAKDIQGEPNPSVLVMGDSGTKKTTFLAQVPGIYVFDFDGGMATVRGKDVQYETFKDAPTAQVKALKKVEGFYERGKAWPAFIKKLNEIGEEIDKGKRVPVGLDSLTTMANVCMNYVLAQAGHNGAPQIQHWGAQIQLLETVMDQLTAWPVPLIVTAHLQRNTNDLTQVVEMLPLVTGKFAGKIGIYFDEVYLAKVKGKADKREYILQTESDSTAKQVKTRYNVKDETPTDWTKVYDQIRKVA